MISQILEKTIRTVPDFPKPGVGFKDLTPVYQDASLCNSLVDTVASHFSAQGIQAVIGIESRGFILGAAIAFRLGVPFVPVRKKGKLPFSTFRQDYQLEYGFDSLEMHTDAIEPGARVLVHDDVLATGGTANAVRLLVEQAGAMVVGYSFVIELAFLNGKDRLLGVDCQSLVVYN